MNERKSQGLSEGCDVGVNRRLNHHSGKHSCDLVHCERSPSSADSRRFHRLAPPAGIRGRELMSPRCSNAFSQFDIGHQPHR